MSLIRVCLSRYRGWGDLGTQYMLYHVEASIAVTMAAVASYRAVFVERSKRQEEEKQQLQFHSPGESPHTLRGKVRKMRKEAYDTELEFSTNGPKSYLAFPRHIGTKLGVMTYIKGSPDTTQKSVPTSISTFDSELATLESSTKCPSSTTGAPNSIDNDSWKMTSSTSA